MWSDPEVLEPAVDAGREVRSTRPRSRTAQIAAGDPVPVVRDVPDDLAEREGRDREVVGSEPERGQPTTRPAAIATPISATRATQNETPDFTTRTPIVYEPPP